MTTNIIEVQTEPVIQPDEILHGGISTDVVTIKGFIDEQVTKHDGLEASQITDVANRAAALGFTASANVKYSDFLQGFMKSPELRERYMELYPCTVFLPWQGMHAVIAAMDLWVDLPQHYRGAIPPEQVGLVEDFAALDLHPEAFLRSSDWLPCLGEAIDKTHDKDERYSADSVNPIEYWEPKPRYRAVSTFMEVRGRFNNEMGERTNAIRHMSKEYSQTLDYLATSKNAVEFAKQWHDNLFVIAPKAAFSEKHDWLERARRMKLKEDPPPPRVWPNDPLVVKFVHGGCLIVAAWGDEAAFINEAVQSLKL